MADEPVDETTDDSDDDHAAEEAAAIAAVAALAALIGDDVTKALAEDNDEHRVAMLSALATQAFTLAYEQAGGTGSSAEEARAYVFSLQPAFGILEPDGTDEQQERMTDIIAHGAVSAGTMAAALDNAEVQGASRADVKFEWRTQRDDRVRDMHRAVDGQLRAGGDAFDVGGHPQRYPGHAVGPPEAWINCRCYLRVEAPVTAATEPEIPCEDSPSPIPTTLVAREFDTAKRKKMAAEHTAMPDGSFPIANEEDLRNAIQAIGRAKDPDAVKAHIRRRAKALGLTDLIPESWTASGEEVVAWAKSTSPPGTHDAPGWLTNPKETQRLRDYWAKGEGAAKIRWGQPGDFDRCRKQLVKYVQNPEHLAGTCANLHFVALGFWPNQGPHAGKHGGRRGLPGSAENCSECANFDPDNTDPQGAAVTAAFSAVAELDDARPPREWFTDPGFDGPTALTVTDEGEVLGHIGTWDQCHVGYGDTCVPPPHSSRDYAHFRTGYVATAGGDVAVGNLTLGTGHAPDGIAARAAVEHYDNTGTAVADVAAGEDAHGIWVHGMTRPGVTREQVHALRAGTVSGDWRTLGGQYELVAALVVNVPGFPIPRSAETLAASGRPLSLVAAGIVTPDPNALDIERIAMAVVHNLTERDRRAANVARVAALRHEVNIDRVAALVATVGV